MDKKPQATLATMRTRCGADVVTCDDAPPYEAKVIDVVDGVRFVDVTRRGRNTQFIGGIRPRKGRK